MGRSRKEKRTRHMMCFFLLLFFVFMLTSFAVWCLKTKIEPNLEDIGKIKAKAIVSQIVNDAVNGQLYESGSLDELLIRKSNEAGQLEVLQANTREMNLLITEISGRLQEEYDNCEDVIYNVPFGVLLGDKILSQTGPDVDIRIVPLTVSAIDFETEFVSEGINQTKYKVYIDLTSEVKVLAPFAEDTFEVETTVLVAEAIILGNVPGSYVNVPEEDILDVTNE